MMISRPRLVLTFAIVACVLLATAGPSLATHYPVASMNCYDCHSMSASATVVSGQSSQTIKSDSRITALVAAGWAQGTPLPCVYCHYEATPGGRDDMVDMWKRIENIQAGVGDTHWGMTLTSWKKSSIASALSVSTATGMECNNCHYTSADATRANGYVTSTGNLIHGINTNSAGAGYYPEPENLPAHAGRHNMLGADSTRRVNDADVGAGGAGNDLCDDECHNPVTRFQTITGITYRRATHLAELDGEALKNTNCVSCHDSHVSSQASPEKHLFTDGVTTTSQPSPPAEVAVVDSDCLTICHNKGAGTAYESRGHGAQYAPGLGTLMNRDCGSCHDSTLAHNPAGAEGTPAEAKAKYRLTGTLTSIYDLNCLVLGCHTTVANHFRVTGATFNENCRDCHEGHGSEMPTGQTFMVNGTVNAVTGVVFTNTTASGFTQMYNGASNSVCGACHQALIAAKHGTGKNGTDCNSCHAHKSPTDTKNPAYPNGTNEGFVDPPATATYACGDCHLKLPTSGAHVAHASDDADYTDCEACHGANAPNGYGSSNNYATWPLGSHGNQVIDLPSQGYSTAGTTNKGDDTCGTNTCHRGATSATLWGDTILRCDACHYFSNSTVPEGNPVAEYNTGGAALSSSHTGHFLPLASASKSAKCSWCHTIPAHDATYGGHISVDATGAGNILRDKAMAVEQEASLAATTWLGTLGTDYTDPIATATSTHATCSNWRCHDPSNRGTVAGTQKATWMTAIANCFQCHGDLTTSAWPTTGSHTTHKNVSATYVCNDCHPDPGADQQHMLKDYNGTAVAVAIDFTYNTAYTTDYTSTTYTNCTGGTGLCHVNATAGNNPNWGGTSSYCEYCHTGATDKDSFAVDKVAAVIATGEYNTYGHGAKGVSCSTGTTCHNLIYGATTHTFPPSGSNPWRLTDLDGLTATGLTYSCSYNAAACHLATTSAPRTGVKLGDITTHSKEAMSAAGYTPKRTWPAWVPQCVNCHDPHGDGTNLSLIQRELYDKGAFPLPSGALPSYPSQQTNLAFTNDSLGEGYGSYAYSTDGTPNYSGVCQECHEAADHVSYRDGINMASTGHPGSNPGDCSGCHKHDSAFKPSGCNGCHGGGNNTPSAGNYWPDSVGTGSTWDDAGEHVVHVTALARKLYNEDMTTTGLLGSTGNGNTDTKQRKICAYCHPDPFSPAYPASGNWNTVHNVSPYTVEALGTVYSHRFWDAYSTAFAATDAVTFATASSGTCTAATSTTNFGCHNRKTANGTYAWYATGSFTACTPCHTAGGATSPIIDPTSGLHDNSPSNPTVSGVAHDDAFYLGSVATGAGCSTCHASLPDVALVQTSTHINGTAASNDTAASTNEYSVLAAYTDGAVNAGYCSGTAAPPAGVGAGCHGGGGLRDTTGDLGTWAREWSTQAYLTTNTLTLAASECNVCHGSFAGGWTFGTGTHNATDLNVEHGYNWDGDAIGTEVQGKHSVCMQCHNYGDTTYIWTTHHRNSAITMNSSPSSSYQTATRGCTVACHDANPRTMEGSGWAVNLVVGPDANCAMTGCHDGVASTGRMVGNNSPHVTATGYTCAGCHMGHTGAPVFIPNKTALGINYTVYTQGINLGNSVTSHQAYGTTEAQVCWNCHDSYSPAKSEWGTNTGGTYNYGSAVVSGADSTVNLNWTTAYWQSANFSYKNGFFNTRPRFNASTGGEYSTTGGTIHNAAGTVGTQGNALNLIGCSYCHDVHDTFGRSGKPYLRGTWFPSGYKEDGAPRSGQTYTSTNSYGAVPRGAANTNRELGGYWIDQNSNTPTSGYTNLATNDGLCNLCHTEATLTAGKLVLHRNAVKGFAKDSATARNIFREGIINPNGVGTTNADASRPNMFYESIGGIGNTSIGRYGFRGSDSGSYRKGPYISARYAGALNVWGVTVDNTTLQSAYHQFTCSKCHNPHASRLPALMITNCLDTKVNTWDDQLATASGTKNCPNETILTTDDSYNHRTANFTSAMNCHRVGTPSTATEGNTTGTGAGWNTVTPW